MSDPNGENFLLVIATDPNSSEARKIAAIKGLGELGSQEALDALLELGAQAGDDPATLAAIEAVGRASRSPEKA
ncbi:HEAT repeat domain-containing protein [Pseudomonas cannabina]|uniref:HEAT repeat domain-containing protein n=1 Tax=Pseudomonas syringae pv. maculicola str. ES4326 TaxID=629265 RepID=A0A8T8C8I1_PSEYM|nr:MULTISPECIES: HEAT repeat domain-containing protein [Pseudomonas syringae group]KPB75044.1 Uncharacterized protein AC507_3150 [Pseudomonas syringae pv. maculicola]QHE99831.1 hypothetical protein PMA4326_026585 [Pseudomonas syringae pv. maculicola str. ES4326]QQN21902.1 hypothetical protein JGS08_25705 [Pseudomonas cannabina pv. alisalensis]UBY95536.1 hypothetical protein LCG56_15990 [Pseudomonas cannabina pv. alisalensis]